MSSESKKIKPKTDFELVLNYSNQRIWKNDSGAGANAASRVDKFSAIDPLSEIVWSPDKGFALKCVDSSFTNENTSLFRNVGPVLALLQSVTGGSSTTDKPVDDVFVEPYAVICTKSDVSSTDTPARNPTSDSLVIIPEHKECQEHDIGSGDNVEKMNTARGTHDLQNDQKESLMKDWEKNTCAETNTETAIISEIKGNKCYTVSGKIDQRPVNDLLLQADEPKSSTEQNPSPRKHCSGNMDTGVENQVIQIEDGSYTKVEQIIEYKGFGAPGTNLISSGTSPSKKLESTAENDLQTLNCEPTCAATSAVLVSKSNESKIKSQVNEFMILCNQDLPVMHSPSNGRIHMTRNEGKHKSLSDGDSNASLSKEESDCQCHLSVVNESCHSTRMFLAGKKRCNFQQEVIIESKKVKKQFQETCCPRSYDKPDSSFMNLISNMMKGCSQSTQDEANPLSLTLENPDRHRPGQKPFICKQNQDPELKTAYFKSNSHWPSFNSVTKVMSHQVGDTSKDFELGNEVNAIQATPITYCAENNSLYRQYLQSNNFEASKERHSSCLSLQPQIKPINFFQSLEQNEDCLNMGLSKEKQEMTLHSSSTSQIKSIDENVESYALYEREEICHKSNTLGGFWMTRFLSKSMFDHPKENSSMLAHSHKHISHLNNCKIEETREQYADEQLIGEAKTFQDCFINKEASIGLKDVRGNNDHTSRHMFNPIRPFRGLRDSEPMVSMFARRLGAIKQCQQTE